MGGIPFPIFNKITVFNIYYAETTNNGLAIAESRWLTIWRKPITRITK